MHAGRRTIVRKRRQERGHQMTDTWGLFDAGMWLMFLVWGVAWHLCHDDQVDGMDTE